MKKLKLLIAVCALLLGAGQTWAQTDVTSTYLTNAGFDNCTAETSDVAAKTIKDYSTNGWTNTESGEYTTIAVTSYGSTVKVGGSTTPSTKKDGTTVSGNTLGIIAGWGDNVTIQSGDVTLPAGVYTFTVDHYLTSATNNYGSNSSKFGFVTSGSSYLVSSTTFAASTWTTETVTFTLTESTQGKIQIGLKGLNKSGSGSPAVFYDDVTITWTDPLQAAKDALQEEIDKATLCPASEGLAGAIATAQGVLDSATTEAELTEALAALQAADKDAVLRYENGLSDATALAPVVTNFVVNGKFDDSDMSMWTCIGGFQNTGRKTTDDSNAGNMNGSKPWWENWHPSAKVNKMYQTIENIPNGTYRLDITAFVNNLDAASQYVYANSAQTPLTDAARTGAVYEVYTVVTNNQIEVGLEQTTATANWMGIDNVSLRYYGAGDVVNDAMLAAHKLDWEEAKAAAEAAIENTDYANVTGKEKGDLQAEIGKTEPNTAEGYDEATAALTAATQAFVNAKASYDIFAANYVDLEYADAAKKPTITNESTAATIIPALRAYYESHALAEGVTGAVNMTESITDANNPANNDGWTWDGPKNNPASNESWTDADGTNNHSYFDGGNWNGSNWTTTMSQTITIPAGKYLLTAKGRAATSTTLKMAVGEVEVELPHVGNAGNLFDRGWGDASLVFDSKGKGDEIVVTATAAPSHEWFSVCDFRLVQIEDHALNVATEDLQAALLDAAAAPNEVSTLLTNIAKMSDPTAADVKFQTVVTGSEAYALAGAVTAANNIDPTSVEAVQGALETLTAAIDAYNTAKPAYERAFLVIAIAQTSYMIAQAGQQTVSLLVGSMQSLLQNSSTTATTVETAANTAITSLMNSGIIYQGMVMGFEEGQYAPYNNVEGLLMIEDAKAIGTAPANFTNEEIYAQFATVTSYNGWTINTEDVDAIFNGDMAIANGNNPMGWTRSNNGWGQQITGLTTETNGTESTTAWYYNTNGAWQYGNDGVYKMPLAANTAYKLTFKYAKHGSDTNNWMKASVLNSENEGLAVVQYPGASDATLYQSATAYFTTGEAGNYILSLEQNGNVHLTDVSLVKAEPMPLSEGSNYTPELAYYETLTLTRTIKASYNTVCLPFDLSAEQVEEVFGEGSLVYEYEDVPDGTNSTINFNLKSENTITANVPVMVKATAAATEKTISGVMTSAAGIQNVEGTNFDFVGTYNASMTIAAGDYFIGNGAIYRSKGETTIAGFRAYIKAKELGGGARIAKFFINGNEATAIEGLEVAGADNGKIYNLNGQEVQATKKGLYIQNGKKVVVK